jgi:hypothetical protein
LCASACAKMLAYTLDTGDRLVSVFSALVSHSMNS